MVKAALVKQNTLQSSVAVYKSSVVSFIVIKMKPKHLEKWNKNGQRDILVDMALAVLE